MGHRHVVVLVCNFPASLCLARDGLISAEGCAGSPGIWNSGMVVPHPSGVFETLEKMGVMAVLPDSAFDMSLGFMAHCRSFDVDWTCYMP